MAKLQNEKQKAVQSRELCHLFILSINSMPCISGEHREHHKKRAHCSKKASRDRMISKPKGRPEHSGADRYNVREAMRVSGPQYNYFVVRSRCTYNDLIIMQLYFSIVSGHLLSNTLI
jgi:hypothetical protein